MAYEKKELKTTDQHLFAVIPEKLSREYSSLLARIRTIYGERITIQDFLDISEDDFLAQRGIGRLYAGRLSQLQKWILGQEEVKPCKPVFSEAEVEAWDVPCSEIPNEYTALFEKLRVLYDVKTYADILRICSDEFKEHVGVGAKKHHMLLKWRNEILSNPPQMPALPSLKACRINFSLLNQDERALLNKFMRRGVGADEITVDFLMQQSADELRRADGFGKKSANALKSLQQQILKGAKNQSAPLLIEAGFGTDLSIQEIDKVLVEDFDLFLKSLDDEEQFIWKSRSGYAGTPGLTLKEVADVVWVTRERIRQREQGLYQKLRRSLRISSPIFHSKLKVLDGEDILSGLKVFKNRFSTAEYFYEAAAFVADISRQEIASLTNTPRIPKKRTGVVVETDIQLFKNILLSHFPTGFQFLPAGERLLQHQATRELSPRIRRALQEQMFERLDGAWLFPEQVADEGTISQIRECVDAWGRLYGVWQIEALYGRVQSQLRNLSDGLSDFRRFYKAIAPSSETTQFTKQKEKLAVRLLANHLESVCDCVYEDDLAKQFPNLARGDFSTLALQDRSIIRVKDEYGQKAYKHINAFWLPDDFSDVLGSIIENIEASGDPATEITIVSRLNEAVEPSFCATYAIPDDVTLRDVIVACYTGKIPRVWRSHSFVSVGKKKKARQNILDMFLTQQGDIPFHESAFFDYAKKMRGLTNKTMLICTFLRSKCVRLSEYFWISAFAFADKATLGVTEYSVIQTQLQKKLGDQPFLSIGLLPLSFFSALPDFSLHGRHYSWNAYLLSSVCGHAIPALRVVNDEPSPYKVTALLLPDSAAFQGDVIDYVLNVYATSGIAGRTAVEIFDYLKQNQVRLTQSEKLLNRIRAKFGVD